MQPLQPLFVGILLLSIFPFPATAAVFIVGDPADQVDALPGDGVCASTPPNSVCTLRAAVQEANALPGADTISLPAGTYTLTIPTTDLSLTTRAAT